LQKKKEDDFAQRLGTKKKGSSKPTNTTGEGRSSSQRREGHHRGSGRVRATKVYEGEVREMGMRSWARDLQSVRWGGRPR